jgi:hypothetical protein
MGQGQALLDTSLREGFYATETLRQTYLTPPQVVQFAEAAWPAGAPAAKPLTAAELAAAVRVH